MIVSLLLFNFLAATYLLCLLFLNRFQGGRHFGRLGVGRLTGLLVRQRLSSGLLSGPLGRRLSGIHLPGHRAHVQILPIRALDPDPDTDPAFQVNPDPYPDSLEIRIQGFDDQKLKKKIKLKIFFDQKFKYTFP
jgi:hypothetical protein